MGSGKREGWIRGEGRYCEGDAREIGSLSEYLLLDVQAAELEGVLAEEADHGAASVGDVELLSIGL